MSFPMVIGQGKRILNSGMKHVFSHRCKQISVDEKTESPHLTKRQLKPDHQLV